MKPINLLPFLFISITVACSNPSRGKKVLLSAGREAPLGWMNLEIYDDNTFDFTSSGLRETDHYPGRVTFRNDTLYFHYSDSTPGAGKIAILRGQSVAYISGKYPEALSIKINKFKIIPSPKQMVKTGKSNKT